MPKESGTAQDEKKPKHIRIVSTRKMTPVSVVIWSRWNNNNNNNRDSLPRILNYFQPSSSFTFIISTTTLTTITAAIVTPASSALSTVRKSCLPQLLVHHWRFRPKKLALFITTQLWLPQCGIMFSKLISQTISIELDPHWVLHIYSLVPNLTNS